MCIVAIYVSSDICKGERPVSASMRVTLVKIELFRTITKRKKLKANQSFIAIY